MSREPIPRILNLLRSRPSIEAVTVALCAILTLIVAAPAMLQMRERARTHTTTDRFQQLGLGLQSYHETFQSFPDSPAIKSNRPDTKPNESLQLISPLTILVPTGG